MTPEELVMDIHFVRARAENDKQLLDDKLSCALLREAKLAKTVDAMRSALVQCIADFQKLTDGVVSPKFTISQAVENIRQVLESNKARFGPPRMESTDEFWRAAEHGAAKVQEWPEWKQAAVDTKLFINEDAAMVGTTPTRCECRDIYTGAQCWKNNGHTDAHHFAVTDGFGGYR